MGDYSVLRPILVLSNRFDIPEMNNWDGNKVDIGDEYAYAPQFGAGIKNDKKFKAIQTGGPSGGCLTEEDLDTPIDYDNLVEKGSMMGSGGMIVLDEDDCMVNIAKFYLEFTVEESCGKCTPCRIGNKRMLEILTKITDGDPPVLLERASSNR